jgi:hypothetical protein
MSKRATNRPTTSLLRRFEHRLGGRDLSEEKHELIVEEVNEIFDKCFDAVGGCKGFSILFGRQKRSSGDFVEYVNARNHLIALLDEESAHKRMSNLGKNPRKNNVSRNMEMASEFLRRRKNNSAISASELKKQVGKKFGLGRTAAIDAVGKGLRLLRTQASDHGHKKGRP